MMRNLRKIRQQKKQTQLNLEMYLGVRQETISAYENGKAMPNVSTLLKMCKHFHCSSDYLLDLTDIPTPMNQLMINDLTVEESKIISRYRKMKTDQKNKLLGFIEAISD